MPLPRRVTDYGTVIIHAVIVLACLELFASGLRIGADDPDAVWLSVLDPILPTEHLWYRHLLAALALITALAAYMSYVRRARLTARIRLDKARLVTMLSGGPARWAALNVVVLWTLLFTLVFEVISGILLVAGSGGWVLPAHLVATFILLTCVIAHVGLHAAYGGITQLVRVFRPGPLHMPEPEPDFAELLAEHLANAAPLPKTKQDQNKPSLSAHPFATALVFAGFIATLAAGAEDLTRPVLEIEEITASEAPILDGELSDPAWTKAKPVRVLTTQGGDFGGTHEALVEIRAVHDGIFVYFAISWDDPTRSLKHRPLVKTHDGWRIVAASRGAGDESVYAEDKFAVLLTRPGLPLIGGAIHLGHKPARGQPDGVTGRGLHFTPDGSIADLIQWRASHSGPQGLLENAHFGAPHADHDSATGYTGGFALDPGSTGAHDNTFLNGTSMRPERLPRDYTQIQKALGRIVDTPGQSDSESARWWMTDDESVPYTAVLDQQIPDGAIIPSVIVTKQTAPSTTDVRGQARWAAGRWTLEFARRLYTGSPWDVPIRDGTLMWVAAFDHAEKRHTRHLRPFRIEVK